MRKRWESIKQNEEKEGEGVSEEEIGRERKRGDKK